MSEQTKPAGWPPLAGSDGSAISRWRQASRPLWRKYHRAGELMMRWSNVGGRKAFLRRKKWARQYERTLNRIPMPPEYESPNAPASATAGEEDSHE